MRPVGKALVLAASLALVACSGGGNKSKTGAGGSVGTAGTTPATAGTTGGSGSGTGGTSPGPGTAGTTGTAGGGAGVSGTAGSGGSSATAGAAGTGTDGGAGSSSNHDGSSEHGDGPLTTAGCANHNYQLCIDFENGIDTNVWSGGTPNTIVTDEFAHGSHSYHLVQNSKGTGGRLLSKTVGNIKNQVWARFYIHFKPGAPGGHGNIVAAYDQAGNWYEMGYQFDGMMGVWHGGGGEHPRRSKPYIVDQWYCIEAFFDGANAAMPRWWVDGSEAIYYNPMKANGTFVTEAGPTPVVATQFTRMEAGLSAYAGFDIKQPDTVGDQTETRVMTDLWIDDVAFDTQRIGCIE
jgi:hypothetical protein